MAGPRQTRLAESTRPAEWTGRVGCGMVRRDQPGEGLTVADGTRGLHMVKIRPTGFLALGLILAVLLLAQATFSGDPIARLSGLFRISAYPGPFLGLFALAVGLAWVGLRRRSFEPSRRGVVWLGLLGVLLISLDWWVLGPRSYSFTTYELAAAAPIHQYFASLPSGTIYSHAMAGGTDAYALGHYAGQYVNIERLLVTWLPLWLGMAIHKLLIFSLTTVGIYLLGRRVGKAGRGLSLAAAMLFSLTGDFQVQFTFQLGQSFALVPLGLYLLAGRCGRRFYLPGVVLYAVYAAATVAVPQGLMAVLGSIALGTLVIQPSRLLRVIPALAAVAVAVAVNNSETMAGIMAVSPFTSNVLAGVRAHENDTLLDNLLKYAGFSWFSAPGVLLILAAALLAPATGGLARRAALMCLAFPFILTGLDAVPWSHFGLSIVSAVGFTYTAYGFHALAALLVAAGRGVRPGLTILVLAAFAGQFAYYAVFQKATWLATGGLSSYAVEDLKQRDWPRDEPFRVAASHYRIPENIPLAAGLDMATAAFSLEPLVISRYWAALTGRDPDEMMALGGSVGPSLRPAIDEPTARCCLSYDLSRYHVGANLLGIENVRFLISRIPFEGLRLVSGPPEGTLPPRDGMAFRDRLAVGLRFILDPPPLYVYELPRWLPRVFVPLKMEAVASGRDWKYFLSRVSAEALDGTAFAWQTELPACAANATGRPEIRAMHLTGRGFEIELDPAASPGIVIFNAVSMPFWRAMTDGAPAEVFPVNGIHTAVCVPAGARALSLHWERALLRERLAARLGLGG